MSNDTTKKNSQNLVSRGLSHKQSLLSKKYRPDKSDNSNSSMEERNSIQVQLQVMNEGIANLRDDVKGMLKKDEVEQLIMNTVTNLMKNLEHTANKKNEQMINEKVNDMQSKMDSLDFENKSLTEKIEHLEKSNEIINKSIHEQIEKNKRRELNCT
ncbi:hypothetical protein DPMN_089602 [Dreissena polymorpha]|uniref:Uncharacterized protein n=1 Tax=Dreissena polymorpha TaxID=45954 RepID=A0A9D4KW94_DREPO|nr:hypothetical protein DPMN_089602 [Dreissena polymorpha]